MEEKNNIKAKMKELITKLNKASNAYYNKKEIISDYEYDKMYDELLKLELDNDLVLDDSPTKKVGFEVKSNLEKVEHEFPALSLDKTKDIKELKDFLGEQDGLLSFKEDGLTICLTYEDGELKLASTRGNGIIGENITHNAKFFKGVPNKISFKGKLIIRGEALISYKDFYRINETLLPEEQYKNPRNLASGTVRLLDSKKAKTRNVQVVIFELVYGKEFKKVSESYKFLSELGFNVVPYKDVTKENLAEKIVEFSNKIDGKYEFSTDGLVLIYNDIEYGKSLGTTSKFPKNALAFKWKDDEALTEITDIIWQTSRTGLVNPVAKFRDVELEDTTVSKATLINVSNIKNLNINIGATVKVIKANKIIPQIIETTIMNGNYEFPKYCPVCNSELVLRNNNDVETLHCIKPNCKAKNTRKISYFVSKDCFNIKGLSDSTLEKFIENNIIIDELDLFYLKEKEEEILKLEGFGKKSYEKILNEIEKSRNIKLSSLICSLGIFTIGKDLSKKISKFFNDDLNEFNIAINDKTFDFKQIKDLGEISEEQIKTYFNEPENKRKYKFLLKEIKVLSKKDKIINTTLSNSNKLKDIIFVITGDLKYYENRDKLIEEIENNGGKVTGSVSKKTNYLINNNNNSDSSKNKKAKELGIKIITEDDFKKMIE